MTDKKKSFLLYLDTLKIVERLTDEQAGKLLKAFLYYHSEQDLNLDPTLELVFFSFQAQFERDHEKYKNIVERNKINGSKGGRPTKPKEPSGLSDNPVKPKQPDSVNGSDKDSVSGNDKKVTNTLPIAIDKFSTDDLNFAEWFYSRLLIINPEHKKPDLKKWADVIRLMREVDKRTYQQMSDLFLWVNADDFWKGNILSPAKLRKQWDVLIIQMNKVSAPKKAAQDVIDVLNDTSWADNMNLDDAF